MAGAEIEKGRETKKKLARTPEWSSFFLFQGAGGEGFFPPPLLPNVVLSSPQKVPQISMCSHRVPKLFPNVFPRMFPIAPGFYALWYAESSIPMDIN